MNPHPDADITHHKQEKITHHKQEKITHHKQEKITHHKQEKITHHKQEKITHHKQEKITHHKQEKITHHKQEKITHHKQEKITHHKQEKITHHKQEKITHHKQEKKLQISQRIKTISKRKLMVNSKKLLKLSSKTKNKVIVKDDDDNEKEIIIVGDPACPTQSENVALNGIINPQGIRLLANFYPCTVENGGITMNIPDSPHLKLALIYIDNNSDNHAGTLITPNKIQSIENNQGLFSIELDKKMKGNDPITGELTTLDKINGLALYNNGNDPIEFKVGSSVALTTTFNK